MKQLLLILFLLTPLAFTQEEHNAILTAYCSCQSCCSWHYGEDGKPKFNTRPNVTKIIGQTASGKIAKADHTLAAPRGVPFGTKIYVKENNYKFLLGVVEDRGGAIVFKEGKIKIDIYFPSHQEALEFGVKHVTIETANLPHNIKKEIK